MTIKDILGSLLVNSVYPTLLGVVGKMVGELTLVFGLRTVIVVTLTVELIVVEVALITRQIFVDIFHGALSEPYLKPTNRKILSVRLLYVLVRISARISINC